MIPGFIGPLQALDLVGHEVGSFTIATYTNAYTFVLYETTKEKCVYVVINMSIIYIYIFIYTYIHLHSSETQQPRLSTAGLSAGGAAGVFLLHRRAERRSAAGCGEPGGAHHATSLEVEGGRGWR